MTTINDVAHEAGVSKSVVMKVIGGDADVDEQIIRKVFLAMSKLDYRPHRPSKKEKGENANKVIGVVTSTLLADPYFSVIHDSIYDTADRMGYATLFCQNDQRKDKANVDFFHALYQKVDGIVFVGQVTIEIKNIAKFIEESYPMVFIESKIDSPGVIRLNVNNFKGAYDATSYLIKLGHKKIAHIMGRENNFVSTERLKGYAKALEDHKIGYDKSLVKVGNFEYEDALVCSEELISQIKGLTAVFCSNNSMATAFIQAAIGLGISIPVDISVIGFDDTIDCKYFSKKMPLLTTMRQPRQRMGEYAVEAIVNLIKDMEILEDSFFETELIIRESTAPPR